MLYPSFSAFSLPAISLQTLQTHPTLSSLHFPSISPIGLQTFQICHTLVSMYFTSLLKKKKKIHARKAVFKLAQSQLLFPHYSLTTGNCSQSQQVPKLSPIGNKNNWCWQSKFSHGCSSSYYVETWQWLVPNKTALNCKVSEAANMTLNLTTFHCQ